MAQQIRNGTVADLQAQQSREGHLAWDLGKIISAASGEGTDSIFDASGLVVAPGLVDLHVHLREPGAEYKETIASGTRAAAAGGVTSLACMPNTKPPIDHIGMVEQVLSKARSQGVVNVYPVACITRGRAGQELTEMGELSAAGVKAVSDDGDPVASSSLMRSAMQYAGMLDLLVINHAEDKDLWGQGVAHAGFMAAKLGLPGIPRSAMEVMIARDLLLAEETGCRLHIPHVSTAGAVRMIREAKARGVRVTAETAPHYLTLTDACLEGYDTNVRVNPPIAEESDREALLAGVADGTIDAIATDHAPHSRREKETEFAVAAPGICGLETLFALSHTALVESGRMSLLQLLSALSLRPAKILKINKGTLEPGDDADMVVLDPAAERIIDITRFQSQSDNSPFHGRKVRGAVVATFVGGKLIYLNRAYQERWSGPTEGIPVCA